MKFFYSLLGILIAQPLFAATMVVKGNVADHEFTWMGSDSSQLVLQCQRLFQRTPEIPYSNEVVVGIDRESPVVLVNNERTWGSSDSFCQEIMNYVRAVKGEIPRIMKDECPVAWPKGEIRKVYIHNGLQTRLCNQYGEVNVIQTTCNILFKESNFLCVKESNPQGGRCRNGAQSGEQRLEQIPYGQRYVYCNNGRLELISISCDVPYQAEGDHCTRIPGW